MVFESHESRGQQEALERPTRMNEALRVRGADRPTTPTSPSGSGWLRPRRPMDAELLVPPEDAAEVVLERRRSRESKPPLPLPQYFTPLLAETS